MVSPRFNLIEKLQIMSTQKPAKDLSKKTSFDPRDVPDLFHRMYDVANSLASREGLIWIQVKHAQDTIDRMQKQESAVAGNVEDEPLPPLLQTQLLEFLNSRREQYLQSMTQLLELFTRSEQDRKEKPKDE